MKLIIAGGRDIKVSKEFIKEVLRHNHLYFGRNNEIVSGCANGIDLCGEEYANHWNIDVKRFPADWETHGKAAGPIRNKQMAEYADALLLIWDGESHGSANMKKEMLKLGKPVYEVILRKHGISQDL
jgi:hypothetical protein